MGVIIKTIPHNSIDYQKTVELRYDILRKPLGLNYTTEQLAAENTDYHIAAFEGDDVLGCIILTPFNNAIIKMRQFAVKTDLQKKGIGTKIVQFCEEWAKTNKYKEIQLHARMSAVPFYQRLNYNTIGDTFTEVGLPHYKMVKAL